MAHRGYPDDGTGRDADERKAQRDEQVAADKAWAASYDGRLSYARKQLVLYTASNASEMFGPETITAGRQEWETKITAIKAERATCKDDWDRETTIERRAAWNDAVRSGKYNARNGSVLVGTLERAIGYSLDELRAAVKRHNL